MERNTDRRTVVVTGASAGIGRGIAVHLGRLGWSVALGARRVDALQKVAGEIDEAGGNGFAHRLDVGSAESVEEFFAAVATELGPVSAVVNNAAAARYGPFWTFTPEEIKQEIDTKLVGSLLVARAGILAMQRSGVQGDILFMTSLAAQTPWPHHLPYAAANAGVEHAVRTMKLELEGSGIRLHTLRCDSTMGTEFAVREAAAGRVMPAMEVWFRHGLLRHGGALTVDQVAEAVVEALTLPPGLQYDIFTLTPMAPTGALPGSWEAFQELILQAAPNLEVKKDG
jgi:NAD(P)-dependent dehydrogenase (short-subunit alcohol dehydrogenase family)